MGRKLKAFLIGTDKEDRKVAIAFWCAVAIMILWLVAIVRGWI